MVEFTTCSTPDITSLSFQSVCNQGYECLALIAILNGHSDFIAGIAPPNNATAAESSSKPSKWTHGLFCIELAGADNGFCVRRDDYFAVGRGISIVTIPKRLVNIVQPRYTVMNSRRWKLTQISNGCS
jgi:hypothetical protein